MRLNQRQFGFLLLLTTSVVGSLASAETDGDTLRAIEVISDDPPFQTGDVDAEAFTGSHQVISGDVLQRQDLGVSQILAQESGVQSRQVGGFGTFSSITVRAATPAQTGVFLDGILLNSGGNAVVDLSLLELFSLQEIAVYRGLSPGQLSHGSIGGAVNMVTPTIQAGQPETRVLLGVSSFSTSRFQLMHRRKLGAWELLAALSHQRSDNDFEFLDGNGTPLNAADDTLQKRNNAQVARNNLLARLGYQHSHDRKTDVVLQATSRNAGVPELRNKANNEASLDTDVLRLQVSHRIDGFGNFNSRYTFYLHDDRDNFRDRLSQIGLGAQDTQTDVRVIGSKAYWEYLGDMHTTSLTVDVRGESLDAADRINTSANRSANRKALSGVLQSARYYLSDRLLVSPAVRLQYIDDAFNRPATSNRGAEKKTVINPQLGASFELSPSLTVRANAGKFYRAPSFSELFGSRGLIQGNDDLLPEAGVNADLGAAWQVGDSLKLDASLFASWRSELIATVYDTRGVGQAINVGRARIVGTEFGLNWNTGKVLSARLNVTLQDAQSEQRFAAFNGKQLPGEARQTAYARLQYTRKAWNAYLEATGTWDRFYDQANVLPARNQWLQTLGVKWKKGPLGLQATFNNLTDRQVEDFNGFPRPGRSVTFNLSYIL